LAIAPMMPLSFFTKRNLLIALHDVLATAAAVVLSFYVRFGEQDFSGRLPLLLVILPYFLLLSFLVCYVFDLTMTKWRFISTPDVLNIVKAATALSVALLVLDYIFVAPNVYGTFFIGKTTIIIYWFLEIAFLSGSRLIYRYYRYTRTRSRTRAANAAPALIAGVAADAELVLRSVESGVIRQVWPVGVLSPSNADQGQLIRGVPVLGGIGDLQSVLEQFSGRGKPVERLVMTQSALAPEAGPERLLRGARKAGLSVSKLPTMDDGREPLRLAPVAVEDLLLRPAVKIDYARLESLVRGKFVLVTGGGGSIGSEICRRVVAFGAARLMILENAEPALYAVQESLGSIATIDIDGRIADIRDRERVFSVMAQFKPDIVFHAAALKHVPILERDFGEGVKTNIFGTINVADASLASGAQAMVMISTDKAIEPVSMLGLTKRFAEMYCQALDHNIAQSAPKLNATRFISVRFGNVLASNGSVVPKFKSQIEAGGPVTVTHPDMVRFFMTIREACDLVLTAASHAAGTTRRDVSVYVLNMGQPVKIADLADRLIRLSGFVPGEEIEVVFTGMRPGERLHEILFANEEPPTEIGVDGVMAAKPNEPPMAALERWIRDLHHAVGESNNEQVRAILKGAIPEFKGDRAAAE
jgi:FlaA1/EpsC-like NDP-sugar epimerase